MKDGRGEEDDSLIIFIVKPLLVQILEIILLPPRNSSFQMLTHTNNGRYRISILDGRVVQKKKTWGQRFEERWDSSEEKLVGQKRVVWVVDFESSAQVIPVNHCGGCFPIIQTSR
jgi:hypothetical protein